MTATRDDCNMMTATHVDCNTWSGRKGQEDAEDDNCNTHCNTYTIDKCNTCNTYCTIGGDKKNQT